MEQEGPSSPFPSQSGGAPWSGFVSSATLFRLKFSLQDKVRSTESWYVCTGVHVLQRTLSRLGWAVDKYTAYTHACMHTCTHALVLWGHEHLGITWASPDPSVCSACRITDDDGTSLRQ